MNKPGLQTISPIELNALWQELPPPDEVMRPHRMGAAWPTRHSFARSLIRYMYRNGWRIQTQRLVLDRFGGGEAIYRIHTHLQPLYFVVFSTTIDEAQREDRVIAESWDVTAALCEGELTEQRLAMLRREVPRQEEGRLDADTLVLTRANRSARFFDATVDALSRGRQVNVRETGPAGYLIRSTAFYANGKFGTKPFEALTRSHPVGVSYRAQMLAAWMLREFSLDLVHSCAARRRASATEMDSAHRRNLGIGNATGLGMVPFFVKHPHLISAWASVRELALAHVVRATSPSDVEVERLSFLLRRGERHFQERRSLDRSPFTAAEQLQNECRHAAQRLEQLRDTITKSVGWLPLYTWAQDALSDEGGELLRSMLCEIDDTLDTPLESLSTADEAVDTLPGMPIGELHKVVDRDYAWAREFDFTQTRERHYFWFISENHEEPRRGIRGVDAGELREQPYDIANQAQTLWHALKDYPPDTPTAQLLLRRPDLRGIVARVQGLRQTRYGETRVNLLERSFLPLQLQKFKLSMYGMQNHDPKSSDWLRVTLFQGAPTATDLVGADEGDWMFPVMEDI